MREEVRIPASLSCTFPLQLISSLNEINRPFGYYSMDNKELLLIQWNAMEGDIAENTRTYITSASHSSSPIRRYFKVVSSRWWLFLWDKCISLGERVKFKSFSRCYGKGDEGSWTKEQCSGAVGPYYLLRKRPGRWNDLLYFFDGVQKWAIKLHDVRESPSIDLQVHIYIYNIYSYRRGRTDYVFCYYYYSYSVNLPKQ